MNRIVRLTLSALYWLVCVPAARAEEPPLAAQLVDRQHPAIGGWQLAELADTMHSLHDRSYANGKRLFERAHCTTCHRQDNLGSQFGPDLTRLNLQFQPLDILRDILDPSRRIADARYDSWAFETASGRVVAGMILQETDEFVKVLEKPRDVTEPITLMKNEIDGRMMSLTSIMPQGLVDSLTREEIADLVAYVAARGDPTDPIVHPSDSKTAQLAFPNRAIPETRKSLHQAGTDSGAVHRRRFRRRMRCH